MPWCLLQWDWSSLSLSLQSLNAFRDAVTTRTASSSRLARLDDSRPSAAVSPQTVAKCVHLRNHRLQTQLRAPIPKGDGAKQWSHGDSVVGATHKKKRDGKVWIEPLPSVPLRDALGFPAGRAWIETCHLMDDQPSAGHLPGILHTRMGRKSPQFQRQRVATTETGRSEW